MKQKTDWKSPINIYKQFHYKREMKRESNRKRKGDRQIKLIKQFSFNEANKK